MLLKTTKRQIGETTQSTQSVMGNHVRLHSMMVFIKDDFVLQVLEFNLFYFLNILSQFFSYPFRGISASRTVRQNGGLPTCSSLLHLKEATSEEVTFSLWMESETGFIYW